jgi:hypothetical protein
VRSHRKSETHLLSRTRKTRRVIFLLDANLHFCRRPRRSDGLVLPHAPIVPKIALMRVADKNDARPLQFPLHSLFAIPARTP